MAINYTVSYTFSPSTTISSSQVNTNFSDNANTWNGIEAETKTVAKIKMDADPTIALEVATKQYVDHYSTYRKPVLVYNSSTVVNIETGIDGTSGECRILFPDGNLRVDTSAGRIQCNLAQNAAFAGSAKGGLLSLSVAANTWYAVYAVKTNDNSSNFVACADTTLPLQANFSTLNSNFGTNSWVYIGLVRYGDNSAATTAIVKFVQSGNTTLFFNNCTGNAQNGSGTVLASDPNASTLTYTYAAGTGTTQIPNNIVFGYFEIAVAAGSGSTTATDSTLTINIINIPGTATTATRFFYPVGNNMQTKNGTGVAMDLFLTGFSDRALGVGSNPIL